MNNNEINIKYAFNIKVEDDQFPELTIGEYLILLLKTLWTEEESFNGKRPFGNSGWKQDLYVPLVRSGLVDGKIDEDGYIDEIDEAEADALILNLIDRMCVD
jgi:hypothetical protein